jgi:hypothetical protein
MVYDCGCRTRLRCLSQESMAIGSLSRQGKEEVARLQLSRIGADPADDRGRHALDHAAANGTGDLFDPVLHVAALP